jgi:hypothetical protein
MAGKSRQHTQIRPPPVPLLAQAPGADLGGTRQATYMGRPWGSDEFVQTLEEALRRDLAPRKVEPKDDRRRSLR